MQQILSNLLSNAIKFTPEGGRVLLKAEADATHVVLTVTDTGVGIAPEEQELVFEKFRQSGNPLTREHAGTGLGLSIVRELTKLLGGEVTLQSELGRGSTFTVRLPLQLSEEPRLEFDLAHEGIDLSKAQRVDARLYAGGRRGTSRRRVGELIQREEGRPPLSPTEVSMTIIGSSLSLLLLASPTPRAAVGRRGRAGFRNAVQPLADHRKGEGFHVVQVLTTDVLSADEIRAGDGRKLRVRVNKFCRDYDGPSYVLLVGAVEPVRPEDAERTVVPALDGGVGRMKGQPSDNGYGCLDDGRQPTVPVGRFPARTEPEAIRMVRKTLAYEADDKPGEWRHRLTVLAGIPAYNPIVDRLVESMAFARFDKLDPSWTGRAIYSNPSSRFTVPDNQLRDQARKYVEGGEAWTLYLGHSNAEGLWGGGAPYLDRDDWATLKIPPAQECLPRSVATAVSSRAAAARATVWRRCATRTVPSR